MGKQDDENAAALAAKMEASEAGSSNDIAKVAAEIAKIVKDARR